MLSVAFADVSLNLDFVSVLPLVIFLYLLTIAEYSISWKNHFPVLSLKSANNRAFPSFTFLFVFSLAVYLFGNVTIALYFL